ncbi:MAG: tRNA (N6-threonylcarbamoyladenosine(37)-N6)-methyltransferase TrmO [Ignavibacteria bacterium GWA2_54_16]|nr:MAG: tRNA (N6-threonylcarbamoyladenosine(37)-N6)-methyltransferase TrmO [Ignavibacteria bacterium GWA2_54_16]
MTEITLTLRPIGFISTPFKSKYAAPRQPATALRKSTGTIKLRPGYNFEQALEDLREFDYIWVIFWFNKNSGWKPMVLPPHGDRKKRGVFSTRSPHRPNPIGLSLCKLVDIKGRSIRIENPDMLDGTPVLDIKPYIPHAESHAGAKSGWIGQSNEQTPRPYKVAIAPEVRSSLKLVDREERREIVEYLKEILTRDPHPHIYRRIKTSSDGNSVIAVKRWRFMFSLEEGTVRVFGVAHDRERGTQP